MCGFIIDLSYRDIELMMLEKGFMITHETIQTWAIKFGHLFSHKSRKRASYGDHYYLDEVFCKIKGNHVYLWRAVDQDGITIDILIQEERHQKAAKRFLKKLKKPTNMFEIKGLIIVLKTLINLHGYESEK